MRNKDRNIVDIGDRVQDCIREVQHKVADNATNSAQLYVDSLHEG